jgi:hypothetical protein
MNDETIADAFSTVPDVLNIVTTIENSMLPRSGDRALMNVQFDGGRPYTAQEEQEFQIQVNANFLEGYKIAQSGILQMNTALLDKERFATFRCLKGDPNKRSQYTEDLTNNIHKALKEGRSGNKFSKRLDNRNTSLVGHGVGPFWWSNSYEWMPKMVGLDDLLIPTDTPLEMDEELGHFGINSWLSAWQLYKMTQAEKRDPGWDKAMGMNILKGMLRSNTTFTPNYFDKPEKMESLWKQRSTYLNSDAIPKLKITTFYHQDGETGKWYRKVIVRENQSLPKETIDPDKFLYTSDKPFADSIDQIIQIQFGDGSVVAPKKYRSVRGLFVLLYSVIELMNKLRCQSAQHVFSNLVPLMRVQNPTDRDRPRMVSLQPYAVVEDGVSFIPNNERHQIDPRLVTEQMSEFRQLMSENSSSYVQDIDTGSSQPQTLGEAQIKLQAANRIVASMLSGAYRQEGFLYEEILRRFMKPVSGDPEVVRFQEDCKADGIPMELMEPRCWKVEITKAPGSGDQTLAVQEATALLQLSPQLDPSARRTVQRDYISVITKNPERANALVPPQAVQVTPGRKAAEDVFGTLMNGVEVGLREGIEQQDYVAAMMASIDAVVGQIKQTDNVGTQQQAIGLSTAIADVRKHLQLLEQDPNETQFVAAASKELGSIENEVKGFVQRQQEAADKAKIDPEAEAAIHTQQIQAAQDMHIAEQKSQQAMQQKQAAFDQKMNQDQQKFSLQMQQQSVELQALKASVMAEMEAMKVKAMAEIEALQQKTAVEIQASQAKTDADIAATKKRAAATPKQPKAAE